MVFGGAATASDAYADCLMASIRDQSPAMRSSVRHDVDDCLPSCTRAFSTVVWYGDRQRGGFGSGRHRSANSDIGVGVQTRLLSNSPKERELGVEEGTRRLSCLFASALASSTWRATHGHGIHEREHTGTHAQSYMSLHIVLCLQRRPLQLRSVAGLLSRRLWSGDLLFTCIHLSHTCMPRVAIFAPHRDRDRNRDLLVVTLCVRLWCPSS